jgi:flavin reductase (DIM6/NTAB) family NADH-FMN oxidoreductase RutF
MAMHRKAKTGTFNEQAIEFSAELPPRGGVLEYVDVVKEIGEAARLDRADKALDAIISSVAVLTVQYNERSMGIVVATIATASQHPPRISIAVRRQHPIHDLIKTSGFFALNLLERGQQALEERFCTPPSEEANQFAGVEYDQGVSSGAPVLRGVLAFLECRVASSLDAGDHTIFLGDLLDGGALRDGQPMISQGEYKPTSDIAKGFSVGS